VAAESSSQERRRQAGTMPPFHQRFNIKIGSAQAQKRFINRVRNRMPILFKAARGRNTLLSWLLADKLGLEYDRKGMTDLESFLGDDFYSCLEVLEALYQFIKRAEKRLFDGFMKEILSESEADLGIQWRDGVFWPSGAKLLDETLVNENLRWLSDLKYTDVLAPFEKGLHHFIEAQKQPEKLSDVITDVYEALEALAKIVTGRDKDLSGNAELFVSELKLSDHYSAMLKAHISYANEYRHAPKQGRKRKAPLLNEVEAFVYTTGLFIRLAIQQPNPQT
jgi:hypothetical protein